MNQNHSIPTSKSFETKTIEVPSGVPKEFLEELEKEREKIVTPRSNKLSKEIAVIILNDIVTLYQLRDTYQALTVLTVLLHHGATSKKADGNLSSIVYGKTIKLSDIRGILAKNNCKNSIRKLARAYGNSIYKISVALRLPGNLYPKISRMNPEKTFHIEEKCWLSDFQSTNDRIPGELKKLIIDSFYSPSNQNKKKNNK
jgi:hypothetical protein